MIRLVLKSTVALLLLWLIPILLIRAQPYDDQGIEGLLTATADCPAPCFMGVRPGTMHQDEALAILRAHQWVASIDGFGLASPRQDFVVDTERTTTALLQWQWSQARPEWVLRAHDGRLVIVDQEVIGIILETSIPLGELLLAVRDVDAVGLRENTQVGAALLYEAWDAEQCLWITTEGSGPPHLMYHWPVKLYFQMRTPSAYDTACGQ